MAHSHSILKNFDTLIGFMWVRSHNNCSSTCMRSVKNSRSLSSVMVHVILPFRVQALIAYIHINRSFIIQARRTRHLARSAKRVRAAKATRAQTTTTATAVKTSLKKMNLTLPPPAPPPPRRFSRVGDVIKNCVLNISRFVLNALSYDFFYRLYP